ncbi:beta-phosphoglucomutase [Mycoplasma sp. Ms02]|uniref:beta-phosphoglucomutase n=1 Tax=Mycoplasma sp. Ms02 TaxID=353851 RepID=UPI001C8A84EF|nr:beta-phosphoglucomutase [Mycoplasma sp. Ms02]QZE12622.1 beta-phosphoglucomutase [Mycoplasma sp. Ms02]
MEIKGILFDLDGVITDTASLHYESWAQTVKKLGIDYTEAENENLRGLPRPETLKAIVALKKPDLELTKELSDQLCKEKNDLYVQLLKQKIDPSYILPNIKEFILDCKQAGIKLSIASSSYNAPFILEKLGLIDYFDAIVYPGDVKKGKPDPEIFEKAAQLIDVPKENCIGLEDAIAGVQAIKGANIKSVAFDYNSDVDFSLSDLVLHTTADLTLQKLKDFFK